MMQRLIMRFMLVGVVMLSVVEASSEDTHQNRPNILFAISDDQSMMHASAYGDKATLTPGFDRVAREGVLFRYAFTASPSCAPARSAILTGRNIWEIDEAGVLFGTLKGKHKLFTHELGNNGYELASTGKTWGPGRLQGLKAVAGKAYHQHKLAKRKPGMSNLDYAKNFEQFLSEREKGKPFCFWYGSSEPHQRYEVGAWKKTGKQLKDARLPKCLPDDPVTRGEILDYGLEIEHFDAHLLRMVEALEKQGLLENTIIVVTSDHGNPMPRSKCNLYDSGTRVPLAVRYPKRIPGGRVVDDIVNLTDVGPTLLEMAGVAVPEVMSGRSLRPTLTSRKDGLVDATRDFTVTAFERHIIARRNGLGYPMRSIRTHDFAYIRNYEPERWPAGGPEFVSSHQGFYGDCDKGASKTFILKHYQEPEIAPYYQLAFAKRPGEELYDMKNDPGQLKNLADDPKYAQIKKQLEARMVGYLKKTGDPRMKGLSPWDDYYFTDQRIFKFPNWKEKGMVK